MENEDFEEIDPSRVIDNQNRAQLCCDASMVHSLHEHEDAASANKLGTLSQITGTTTNPTSTTTMLSKGFVLHAEKTFDLRLN